MPSTNHGSCSGRGKPLPIRNRLALGSALTLVLTAIASAPAAAQSIGAIPVSNGVLTLSDGDHLTLGTEGGTVTTPLPIAVVHGSTLTLLGNNDLTGGITVSGTLVLGSSGAAGGPKNRIVTTGSVIDFADGTDNATPITISSDTTQLQVLVGAATQSGVIDEDQPGRGFEKIGDGTLALTAINTYTGTTTISAGALAVADTANLGASGTDDNALILDGATARLLLTGGYSSARPVTIGAAGGTVDTDAYTVDFNPGPSSEGVTFNGLLHKQGSGTLNLRGYGAGSSGVAIDAGTLALWTDDFGASFSAAGTGTITIAGGATLAAPLSGFEILYNDLVSTGSGATPALVDAHGSGSGTNLFLGGVLSGSDFAFVNSAYVPLSGPNSAVVLMGENSYGATQVGAGVLLQIGDAGGTSGSLGTGNVTLDAHSTLSFARSDETTVANTISGAGAVSQAGSGTTILTATNSYTGGTQVSDGVLQAGAAGAFGMGGLIQTGGKLDLHGFDATFTSVLGIGGQIGSFAEGSLAAVTFDLAGGSNSYAGTLVDYPGDPLSEEEVIPPGVLALVKSGGGTLTLSGMNSYTGGTLLTDGTLIAGSDRAFGYGPFVQTGGTLDINGRALTLGTLGGTGGEITNNAESQSNNNTFSFFFFGGTPGSITVDYGETTYAGVIHDGAGTVSLTLRNGADLTLTGINDFTGGLFVTDQAVLGLGSDFAAGGWLNTITTSGTPTIRFLDGVSNVTDIYLDTDFTRLEVAAGAEATQYGYIDGDGFYDEETDDFYGYGLTKIGDGRLNLLEGNTYSGPTRILGGTIAIDDSTALGDESLGNTVILDGATATLLALDDVDLYHLVQTGLGGGTIDTQDHVVWVPGIDFQGTLIKTGSGDLQSEFFNSGPGGITVMEGAFGVGTSSPDWTGTIDLRSGTTLYNCGCGDLTLGNAIIVDNATIDPNGVTMTLDGPITGGDLTLADSWGGGTIELHAPNSYGATHIGADTHIVVGDPNGGNSVASLGTGPVTFADPSSTLTLGVTGGATFANIFVGQGSILSYFDVTLTGSNSPGNDFTGMLLVDGNLKVNGAFGDTAGGTALVALLPGSSLGGSGTIHGDVDFVADGTLAPGNSPGTLTVTGNLGLTAATILNYEFGAAGVPGGPANDLTVVGGNLTLDGTINVSAGPGFSAGYYRVFSYGGSLTDNGLTLNTMPAGYTVDLRTNVPGQVNLLFNDGSQIVQYWDGTDTNASSAAVTGDGGVGVWNATSTNWTSPPAYVINDAWQSQLGIFAGAAGGVVTVDGTQAFQELRFQTDGYSLVAAGSGGGLATTGGFSVIDVAAGLSADVGVAIGGVGGLTKTGAGTLVLGNDLAYAGPTVINGGTLRAARDLLFTAGSMPVEVDSGATFDLDGTLQQIGILSGGGTVLLGDGLLASGGAAASTFSGAILGTGTFRQIGAGPLTLSGTSMVGALEISPSGNLQIGASGSVTAGAIDNGGTLGNAGSLTGPIANGGTLISIGTITGNLQNDGGASASNGGTLTGDVENFGTFSSTGTITGTLTNDGGTSSISGTLSGGVFVDGGAVGLTGITTGIDRVAVSSTATGFFLNGFDTSVNAISGNGTIDLGGGATTLTIGADGSSSSFSGMIVNGGTVIKEGAGSLGLGPGARIFASTTIDDGFFAIGMQARVTGTVTNNAELLVAGGTLPIFSASYDGGRITGDLINSGLAINDGRIVGNVVNTASGLFSTSTRVTGNLTNDGNAFIGTAPNTSLAGFTGQILNQAGTVTISTGEVGGALVQSAGAQLVVVDLAFLGGLSGDGTITLTPNATSGTFLLIQMPSATTSTFAGSIVGDGVVVKAATTPSGTPSLTLTGNSSFTGAFANDQGPLIVANGASLAAPVYNSADLTNAGTIGGLYNLGSASIAVNTDTGIINGAVFNEGNLTSTGRIDGTITNTGTLSLRGIANSPVFQNSGTVTLTGTTSGIGAVTNSGTFDLAGFTTVFGSLAGSGGEVKLGSGALTTGGNNSNTLYAGIISGSGSLTKIGTGTFTLYGANTYTGLTTVTGGALSVAAPGSLAGNVTNNALFTSTGTVTGNLLNNGIAGISGTLTGNVTNNGEFQLSGSTTGINLFDNNAGAALEVFAGATSINVLNGPGSLVFFGGGLTLGASNASMTISGPVTGSSGSLTKAGTGTLTLTGANSATISATVSAGTLAIAAGSGWGGPITNGGTLQNAGTIGGLVTNNNMLASTGILGGGLTNSGTAQVRGQLVGSVTNLAGTLTLSGATTGIGAFTQSAGATFALAGNSTSIGGLSGAGTVSLGSATLSLGAGNGASDFSGVISGSGGLTKLGTGTATLRGVNTYTGLTTISGGTLAVQSGQLAGSVTNDAGFILNGVLLGQLNNRAGGTATVGGQVNGGVVNLGQLTSTGILNGGLANSGTASVSGQLNGAVINLAGTLTLTGTTTGIGSFTQSAGAIFDLAGNSTTIGGLSGAGNVSLGSATLSLGAGNGASDFSGVISGSGGLTKLGTGTATLRGVNTYTGLTTVSAGTLALQSGGQLAGSVANDAGFVLNGLLLGQLNNRAGGIATVGGRVDGGVVNLGQLTSTGILNGGLTNSGTVLLSGQSNGAVNNLAGALMLTGATSGIGLFTQSAGATFNLAGNSATIGGLSGAGTVSLGSATLGLGAGNVSGDFSGVISGSGGLTKLGTGTATLRGANTYTGLTTVSGGTLAVQSGQLAGSVANDAGFLLNGVLIGQLNNRAGGTATIGGRVDGGVINLGQLTSTGILNGGLTNSGTASASGQVNGAVSNLAGTLRLTGPTTGIGAFTQSAGATFDLTPSALGPSYTISIGSLAGAGSVLLSTTNLTLGTNNQSALFAGAISGAGSLTKAGGGTFALTGDNNIAGGTTIAAGALQIGNGGTTGTLGGPIVDNAILVLNRSNAFTLGGAIGGTGLLLQAGTGATTLTGANTYSGGTWVMTGRLVGNAVSLQGDIGDDATLEFAQATAGTYAGRLSGVGVLEKTGLGLLTLSGDSSAFTGGTFVLAGGLNIAGSLSRSLVTVGNGGTLYGNGIVGGLSVLSGGTVAPGNSVGLLRVNGNVVFAAGSTYAAEVGPTGADLILASGTARLAGNLSVTAAGVLVPFYTSYVLLQADAGRSGTFDTSAFSGFSAAYRPEILYNPTQVILRLAPNRLTAIAGSLPLTFNEASTANRIDAAVVSGFNPQSLMPLYLAPAGEFGSALDALSGEIYASTTRAMLEDRLVREATMRRLVNLQRAPDAVADGAWIEGLRSWGSGDGDGNASRFHRDLDGFVVGYDHMGVFDGGSWQVGAEGHYTRTRIGVDRLGSRAEVERAGGGVHFGFATGNFAVRLGVNLSALDLDAHRAIAFTGFSDSAAGSAKGVMFEAFGEAAYAIPLSAGTVIEPFANIAVTRVRFDPITEHGGPALYVRIPNHELDLFTAGVRGSARVSTGGIGFSLDGSLGVRAAFGDRTAVPIIALAASPNDAFAIRSARVDATALAAELDARFDLSEQVSVTLGYSGVIGTNERDHAAKARISVRF